MNKCERAALRHANKVLKAEGGTPQVTLSKGYKTHSCLCPISRTVAAGLEVATIDIGTTTFYTRVIENVYEMAPTVSDFVLNFDHGLYPHLILTPGEA